MYIFYSPEILQNNYHLSIEESKHCMKVLRHKKSDIIHLMDGKGAFYTAEISEANPSKIEFRIIEQTNSIPRDYYIHIAIAPTKNINRFEWFLEKSIEMGIDEITPLFCDNSERKTLNIERLSKIIISASKLSKQAFFPILNPLLSCGSFIDRNIDVEKYIAHCHSNIPNLLSHEQIKSKKVEVLIGPEGDFSKNEIKQALSAGYKEISLGESRLRTETAGLVSCFALHFINQ